MSAGLHLCCWLSPDGTIVCPQHQANCHVSAPSLNYSFGDYFNRSRCEDVPLVAISVGKQLNIYAFAPSTGASLHPLLTLETQPNVRGGWFACRVCFRTVGRTGVLAHRPGAGHVRPVLHHKWYAALDFVVCSACPSNFLPPCHGCRANHGVLAVRAAHSAQYCDSRPGRAA